ncbi:hypothetical protein Tco_0084548 [Tanacetum coccineum]
MDGLKRAKPTPRPSGQEPGPGMTGHPGNVLISEVGPAAEEHRTYTRVSGAPQAPLNPEETECLPRPVVLHNRNQVSKVNTFWSKGTLGQGSRQNGSVTSGKGLALRAGHGGPSFEPVGCRRTARAAHAARAGRRVPAGGRTGNGSFGGLPRASNSQLRTGTDKGNPTV